MKKIKNNLKTTIILSVIIVSLTLVYLANSLSNKSSDLSDEVLSQKIEAGIESYIDKQQKTMIKDEVNPQKDYIEVSIDDDPVLGDKDAPVTLVEFSDYECPFCKRHFIQTYPQLKADYIDKGLVKMVFRDFPLSFHDPLSTQESMAANCIREQWWDKAYFQFHDLIFKTTTSNGRWMEKSKLYELAQYVNGMDISKFKECLDTEKYKAEVQHDIADGQKYGVSWTPWFFINGRELKWAQPYSEFKRLIEEELNK